MKNRFADDVVKNVNHRDKKNGKNWNNNSPSSPTSHENTVNLKPSGDYRTLPADQKAEVIYDITYHFTHQHLNRGDRTVDRMMQSARFGRQRILEAGKAALTSEETEIRLTGAGRASMAALLADYRDFLRVRNLAIWDKDSKEALFVRQMGRTTPQTYELYRGIVETRPPDIIANIAICLIHQTNYLLDRRMRRLKQDSLQDGGPPERTTRPRMENRSR